MMCTHLSTPEEPGIEFPKTNNLPKNLIVPRNELVNSNSKDFPNPTSTPLTAKNLEILSNSTDSSTLKHRSKSPKASTDHSGSVEEIVKQVEDQDGQELSSIDNTTTAAKIASIFHLAKTPGTFQLINLRNIDNIELVGDLVGRLIHFDPSDRILQKYQNFGPPPVAGKNGLLSLLTSQDKMAEVMITSGSHKCFYWGWNPAIFSRAIRLGVRAPPPVPYQISAQSGNWYKPSNSETRDRVAWEILNETIFTKSGIKPNSYELRALADDFYSGREVKDAAYYAHLTERDTLADGKGSASSSFHITSIDMDTYGHNLNRNLYGGRKNSDKLDDLKAKEILNLFLVEVIKFNEIEDALVRVEKDKHLEKSSFTVATVHGTEVRRSREYDNFIDKLNTMEKNNEEAGKAAERIAFQDFVHNMDIHGLDSIMGSQTWSITHIRTIPTLDGPVKESTHIENITSNEGLREPTDETVVPGTITSDNGPRSISSPSIPEDLVTSNETAPKKKKKKKKTKGKGNAKKVARQEEDLESTASETTQPTAKITEKSSHSIAHDHLNYHFDDSTNPVVDDNISWEVVKPRPIKKRPRAAHQSRPVDYPKPYKHDNPVAVKARPNQNIEKRKEGMSTKASGQIATTITEPGQKLEIKSFEHFPAISPPLKNNAQQKFATTRVEQTTMMEQRAMPKTGPEVWAKLEPTVVAEQLAVSKTDLPADIGANVDPNLTNPAAQNAAVVLLPIPSTEHAFISMEVDAEDTSDATNSRENIDLSWTLADEITVKKVINESAKDTDLLSTVSTKYKAKDIATRLLENSPPQRGMTLKYDAPIYLGDFLDAPSRRRQYRSSSAAPKMLAVFTTISDDELNGDDELKPPKSGSVPFIERRTSVTEISLDKIPVDKMFVASMKSEALLVGNAIAARHLSPAESTSMDSAVDNTIQLDALSAIDSISKDNTVFKIPIVRTKQVSDVASLDTIVSNVLQVSDSCSLEVGTVNEASQPPKEATLTSISKPSSIISSTMTIHGPQPRGFHPSFMGLNSPNLNFAVSTSVGNQTYTQKTSVDSFDLAENILLEFSNGWSRQKLSTSSILHVGPYRHLEPSLAQIPFDCTYCTRNYYATTDSPMVLCNGCGPNSGVTYCSVACLLAGSLAHAEVCQECVDNSETPTVNYPTAYQIYYDGTLNILPSMAATFKRSPYAYRQKVFAMYCRNGPFPQLLTAWARRNNLLHTLEGQDASEATKKAGSYFIFKSALTSNGSNASRTNPDSTVICTIKFRPSDHMMQAVDRCLQACFTTNHEYVRDIKEFLFRLIKDLLSDDDSFDCFPHTEDRTTVFYEFQHQFSLEFEFHADMQRNRMEKFDFQLEWPEIEHLLCQFETGEFI
ncbi:5d7f52e7-9cbb-4eb8-83ce-0f0c76ae5f78 [Sclerotinia trifoliorum]|uniref:5d7f52e7-9cbb-4eb8-83ce-0f0c76ae5f78 n=1 Tax=Sclerotinia trifoliorum TaxID=28548 RepID=A0A8H2VT54_9HELO|nr:5d7f52e7-9cbb-4eb8-83ce-0f0c76ae5f78 [Sclerotinia trifoliorum]